MFYTPSTVTSPRRLLFHCRVSETLLSADHFPWDSVQCFQPSHWAQTVENHILWLYSHRIFFSSLSFMILNTCRDFTPKNLQHISATSLAWFRGVCGRVWMSKVWLNLFFVSKLSAVVSQPLYLRVRAPVVLLVSAGLCCYLSVISLLSLCYRSVISLLSLCPS